MEESSIKKKHSYFHASLIVAALLTFILLVVFHAVDALGPNGLFVSPRSFDLLYTYPTSVTPSRFVYGILGLIYAWQALWLFYAFFSIYRHGTEGPLYRSPILLPPVFFIIYIIAVNLNIARLFVWDREFPIPGLIVQLFIPISLCICIAISMVYLTRNLEVLTKNCLGAEKWWIWIGVQNGLGGFVIWAATMAVVNFAIVLQYTAGVSANTAGSAAFGLLLGMFVIWSLVELIFLDRYSRYLFVPYLMIIWVFVGMLSTSIASLSRNLILVIIGISIVSLLAVVKLIVLLVKQCTKPLK